MPLRSRAPILAPSRHANGTLLAIRVPEARERRGAKPAGSRGGEVPGRSFSGTMLAPRPLDDPPRARRSPGQLPVIEAAAMTTTFARSLLGWTALLAGAASAGELDCKVSWVGNSFPGADGRWVQNFFIHANARPDGTVVTWSHWDEGGRRFGVYKDGRVDRQQGRARQQPGGQGRARVVLWKIDVDYTVPEGSTSSTSSPRAITARWRGRSNSRACTSRRPWRWRPTARLMVADSGTGPRQQVLSYDVSDARQAPRLVRAFGDAGRDLERARRAR